MKKVLFVFAFLVMMLGSCDSIDPSSNNADNGNESPKDEDIITTALSLNATELFIHRGESAVLSVTFTPSNATNKTLTWVSSDPEVASVTDGIVTGLKEGATDILVKCGDITEKCFVVVFNYATSLKVSPSEITLVKGESAVIQAAIKPFCLEVIEYNTSDESVANIDSTRFVIQQGSSGRDEYEVLSAKAIGSATITFKTLASNHRSNCKVTVLPVPVPEVIDLGLSVKWASCDLCASSPEERGHKYAWGENESFKYSSSNSGFTSWLYKYDKNDFFTISQLEDRIFTKYITSLVHGDIDDITQLEQEDDTAHKLLGDKWRMPTKAEWAELLVKCTWTWGSMNDIPGYWVKSRVNGESIFLPCPDGCSTYWSSSLFAGRDDNDSCYAFCFDFDSGRIEKAKGYLRHLGFPIRPVYGEPSAPIEEKGTINGHEYVYMGSGTGLKWATMNIGSNTPEDSGDHFAWGETVPKDDYSARTYKWCSPDPNDGSLIKYFEDPNSTVLELEDDAAHVNWGGTWRMPTSRELNCLASSLMYSWTWDPEKKGYIVTSLENDNSIFLPAAGYYNGTDLMSVGTHCSYWSSTVNTIIYYCANCLSFTPTLVFSRAPSRWDGYSIRPVSD